MNHPLEKFLSTYLNQQEEAGIPAFVLGEKPSESRPTPIKLDLPVSTIAPINLSQPVPVRSVPQENRPQQPIQPSIQTNVQVERSHDTIRAELADLYRRGKDCTACSELSRNRTKVVFGAGNASAKIMIIGEGPGFEEDQQGVPFVGPAGQLLNKMLAAINVDRTKDVFISNVIKCRPPGNRTPSPEECRTCMPILKRQIAIIRPSIILLLGKTAASAVLNNTAPINQIHGAEFTYLSIPVVVTYDPTELLRDSSLKRPAWDDLQKFQMRYRELTHE